MVSVTGSRVGGGRAKTEFCKYFNLNSKLDILNTVPSIKRKLPSGPRRINVKTQNKKSRWEVGVAYVLPPFSSNLPHAGRSARRGFQNVAAEYFEPILFFARNVEQKLNQC